jgi:type II secretory pathway pseudopilin PulG
MRCHLPAALSRQRNRRGAWTLIEMMIGALVASVIFSALGALTVYTARSFVALGNYNDLDRYSRHALDVMSRDIRQTKKVSFYATNKLVFLDYDDQTNLTYFWNPATQVLTRQKGNEISVMLTNCDYLSFGRFQRNPDVGFTFYPPATTPEIKLIDVSWKCSRAILGAKITTESVQTAKIVIRN